MKNLKSIVAISFIAVAFGSCADQKKTQAEKAVNNYVAYVDSVGNVASEDLAEKWDDVESDYIAKKIEAESALENLEDRMELDQKLEAGSKKYEEFKANLLAEKQKMEVANYKAKVRSALFVGQQIGGVGAAVLRQTQRQRSGCCKRLKSWLTPKSNWAKNH